MRYLLDVNALVALGFLHHDFHPRVSHWLMNLVSKEIPQFATCSITELGFLRVLTQTPRYGFTIVQGKDLLLRLKSGKKLAFSFLNDDQGIADLPAWIKSSKQITDGHLLQLARTNGVVLATLDEGISGAFLIPGK